MGILPLKVCTVKGDIAPLLADHILGVVLHLTGVKHCQKNLSAGDWFIIQKYLKQKENATETNF